MSIEETIAKRIYSIDYDVLKRITDTLNLYGVNLLDNQGKFNLKEFRNDYFKTYDLLFKNDIPVNGIRYQLCNFVSAVQEIVGLRNFYRFLNGDKNHILL